MFNEIKAGADLSDVRHRLTIDPHNTPPDGVLCRCTHSTQTYHVVHNSHSRYIAAHALTQVAMRRTRDVDLRSSTSLAPRREEHADQEQVGLFMMREEGHSARYLTLVSGVFASG